jgi:DNA-binding SARP family transcriptional activator/WD40 repeat protein
MRIAVLGPLEVLTDELAPVPVPGAKERLLLGVLVAGTPGVVSADRLIETLWDGAPPATARKTLQAHLVRLRSSLEPGRAKGSTGQYVVRRGPGYALTLERSAIDALRIGDLAARGRAELSAGQAAAAAEDFAAAAGLWRGEPFADWPDAEFAATARRRLDEVRRGALLGLVEARLALGRHADVLPELEERTAQEPLQEDWWRLLMLALYRAGRQADALAAGRRVRALLADELGTPPGPALRSMEAAVLAQDPALDLSTGRAPPSSAGAGRSAAPGWCPYKGLASYQVADTGIFHGRRRLVSALVGRAVDTPLLVVSGSSGAGKSSVVRAGLVPALAQGAVPGSAAWTPLIVTPGSRPVDALAPLTGEMPPAEPVLLVVDQCEELWAPGVDPEERTAFLDTVLGLIDDHIVVRCVAVVRGDHVGRLAEHAAFAERLGGAVVLVPALTDPELREIVREPARSAGLTVDAELLDAVVADMLGQAGALPMLSTALVGTWERRQGGRLTLGGYLESGGVAGGLTRAAEAAYGELDDPGRELSRRLLVRLADIDDGGALVRRPVLLAELDLDGPDGAERRAVVETFVGHRLLSVDGDRLEVTHEALLTGWPRLARWLEDDAAGRAVRRHLAPAAREWAGNGRPEEELYRGARLAAALDWTTGADAHVTPVEQEFLDASRARADAELAEAHDRARREAVARHRTRRLAMGLAAVLVVALVAAGLAVQSQRAAERSSLTADANRLSALSTAAGSLDLAFLLAAQGFRLADTPETEDGLLEGLVEHPRATRATTFSGNLFTAFLGNQGRTLTIPAGAEILSWDTTSGEPPGVLVDLREQDSWDAWRGGNASPTDRRTVYFGGEQDAPWIRLADGDGRVEVLPGGALIGGQPVAAAFTPDGRLLDVLVATRAAGGDSSWRLVQLDPAGGAPRDTGIGGTLPATDAGLTADISKDAALAVVWRSDDFSRATLLDLATGSQAAVTPPARDVEVSDYRALASGAAVLWNDGTVTLVDRAGGVVQDLGAHSALVWDVALAPDGSWAATVGDGGEVRVWDVDPATGRWTQRESLVGHDVQVRSAEIDPTGEHLVTASADNQVIVWDVGPDGGFRSSRPGIPGRWLANEPAVVDPGRLIVAPTRPLPAGDQGIPHLGRDTLRVAATFIDPRTGNVVDQVEVGDTVEDAYLGASVAVSPDGRWVAVTSGLSTTVLDARTRDVVTQIVLPPNGDLGVDDRPYPAGVVCCAVWTRDGTRLLLGTGGYLPGTLVDDKPRAAGEIAVVDPTTWDVVDHVRLENAPEVMETDADGRWLAVASANAEEIVIRDAGTLEERHRVPLTDSDSLWSMSFSPDGRLLAGGSELGKLHVIETDTWRARTAAEVTDGETMQVEWLPDSRTVVATSVDGALRLFDTDRALVRTEPLPASLGGEEGYAHVVPDPRDEIVAFNDEWVGLRYPTDPAVWLREACAVAGRDLTRAEWSRYLPGREWQPTCSDLA